MDLQREFMVINGRNYYKIIDKKFVITLFVGNVYLSKPTGPSILPLNNYDEFEISIREYKDSLCFPFNKDDVLIYEKEYLRSQFEIDFSPYKEGWSKGSYGFIPKSMLKEIMIKLQKAANNIIIIAERQEKPCKQCRKFNDLGVSECWWCETKNPTSD